MGYICERSGKEEVIKMRLYLELNLVYNLLLNY